MTKYLFSLLIVCGLLGRASEAPEIRVKVNSPDHVVQSKTLFVIPYGNEVGQIAVEPPIPGSGWYEATTPVHFRLLEDGNFLILTSTADKPSAQVFDKQGRLVRTEHYEIPLSDVAVDTAGDGTCVSVAQVLGYNIAHSDPSQEEDPNNPLPHRALFACDPKGKPLDSLCLQMERELLHLVKRREIEDLRLTRLVQISEREHAFYVDALTPRRDDGLPERRTVRFSLADGSVEVLEARGLGPIRAYDGSMVFLAYDFASESVDGDYPPAELVKLVRLDGTVLAQFRLPKSLYQEGRYVFVEGWLGPISIGPDYLAFWAIDKETAEKPRLPLALVNGVDTRRQYLIVVHKTGKIVYEETVGMMMETKRPGDTDGQGNFYYLNFTESGLEVKQVSLR